MTLSHGRRTAPHRSRRLIAAGASGLAIVAVLAGCGDAAPAATASDDGSCTAPGVTDTEITVASVSPLTGPSATTFAGFAEAAQARFDVANSAGGVGGRTITLVTNDDAGDGATQVTAGRNAVQSQNAFGVLSASRVDTMYDFLKQQGVPVVGYPGQPAYIQDDNVFGYGGAGNIGYYSSSFPERMKAAGATNVAVLAHNSPGSTNSAMGFIQVAQVAGLEVGVQSLDVPLGSFDATSLAIQMKEAGVDSIYAPTLTDSSVSVLRAAEQQGVKLVVPFVSSVYDPKVASQVSQYIQGAMTSPVATKPNELTDDADVAAYLDTMKANAPDTDPSSGFAEAGYISADLFLKGLDQAGDCLSRASFIKGLRGVTGYDGAGLLVAPASFSGGDAANGGQMYGSCNWFVVREGDAWVPDAEPTCGDLVKQTA